MSVSERTDSARVDSARVDSEQQVRSIFLRAIDRTPDEWASILTAECGEDTGLRIRVEQLLTAHVGSGSIHEDSAARLLHPAALALTGDPSHIGDLPEPLPKPGTVIGPYRLLQQIGEGGMGIVYAADQTEPVRRRVALKLIKPGMDSKEVIARFEAEKQALAVMDHPYVARVIDAGTTEHGRPYFVMELVHGVPITDYCDEARLDTRVRLELFLKVCQGVQHAHLKGIVHRDLKPSNVLVTLHDGEPVPKVIDFGVAKALNQKLTEQTISTHFRQIIGTPAYMSPEQAEMSSSDIDTRSDVYSLGVLLYELLTGTTPFDKETLRSKSFDEMRRMIREQEPLRPSQRISTLDAAAQATLQVRRGLDARQLSLSLQRELDWIVMKALEKDRALRYQSPTDLADDIQRYLHDEPVEACPPSLVQHTVKWTRRHPALVGSTAAVLLISMISLSTSAAAILNAYQHERQARTETTAALENERQALSQEQDAREAAEDAHAVAEAARAEAERHAAEAYRQQYIAEIRAGQADLNDGNVSRLYQVLAKHLPQPGRADVRGWEWYYLLSLCQQGRVLCEHFGGVSSVDWSPDGRSIATTSMDGSAAVWDPRTGRLIRRFSMGTTLKFGVAWSPDNQRLAWGSVGDENLVRIWDQLTDQIQILRGHAHSLRSVSFSPDGTHLISHSLDSTVRRWDLEFVQGSQVVAEECFSTRGNAIGWLPGGKTFVVGDTRRRGAKVINAESGEVLRELLMGVPLTTVSATPSGPPRIVLASENGDCWLVDAKTWEVSEPLRAHAGVVCAVPISPDGQMFASGGEDGLVRLWDAGDGRLLATLYGHERRVESLAWNVNGKQLASGGVDRTVRIWEIPPPVSPARLEGRGGETHFLNWSGDDAALTGVSLEDNSTVTWNLGDGTAEFSTPGGPDTCEAVSPDGRYRAKGVAIDGEARLQVTDLERDADVFDISIASPMPPRLYWSPDSRYLAIRSTRLLEVWAVPEGRKTYSWTGTRIRALAWADESVRLAVAGGGDLTDNGTQQWSGYLHIFDVQQRQRLAKVSVSPMRDLASSVAWSPDGKFAVAGVDDGSLAIVAADTGRSLVTARPHASSVNSVDWSPDGRRIASVGKEGRVKIVDAVTGDELLSLGDAVQPYTAVRWSHDGTRLAAAAEGGEVDVWDATAAYGIVSGAAARQTHARMYGHRAAQQSDDADLPAAIADLTRAIELAPSRIMERRSRAVLYARLGQLDEALADLDAAVDLDPHDPHVRTSRLDVYAARGDWSDALAEAAQLVELRQDQWRRHWQALVHLRMANQAAYQSLCLKLVEQDPQHLSSSDLSCIAFTCAIAPQALADYEAALSSIQDVSDPDNQDNMPLLSRGALLYRAGQIEEAITQLTAASRYWEQTGSIEGVSNPLDHLPAYAWYLLAMAHHDLGRYQEVRTWFERAEASAAASLALPQIFDRSHPPGALYWPQRVTLDLLKQEVRTKLGHTSPQSDR